MKLKHLWLKNFCQHADKQIDLSNGLMGILGPNGSGKSNLINGIIYAITGTLPNNLSQYVKRGSEEGSYVQLTFQSDLTDRVYTIRRGIKPRRSELSCEGQGTISRKSKEIDAYLTDTLKIDFNIIKNVLTVSQEDFVSFFRATPAERMEVLTRLFGFTELKTARESLRELLLETKEDNDSSTKLKVYQEMLAMNAQQLKPFESLPERDVLMIEFNVFDKLQKEHADVISAHNTLKYLDRTIDETRTNLQTYRLEESEARKQFKGQPVNPQDIDNLQKGVTYYEALHKKLSDFYTTVVAPIVDLQAQYNKEYVEFSSKTEPLHDEEYLALQDKVAVARKQCQDLSSCEATGVCPTCGQSFPNLHERLEHLREDYARLKDEYTDETRYRVSYSSEKDKLLQTWALYSNRYSAIQLHLESWKDDDTCKMLLATLPPISDPLEEWVATVSKTTEEAGKSCESYKAQLDYWLDVQSQNKEANEILQRVLQDIKSTENTLESLEAKRAEIVATIPKDFMSLEAAKKQKESNDAKLKEYWDMFSILDRRDALYKERDELQRKIDSVAQLAKQGEEKAKLRATLAEVCQVLSPDAFPKYVMIGLLEMLTSNINYYLSTFNSPFTVRIDNNSTELYCEFSNGETFLASELSGGQKMVLAISWRLALHNTFATEESCGFLTLDEPTNHLDENNIQNLTQVMAQVKQAARDKNLQVLVITHEKALEPLFDSVIRL